MIRSILLFLGFRRPPIPPISRRADVRPPLSPIYRRASSDALAKMNALLAEDRRQFPTWYH